MTTKLECGNCKRFLGEAEVIVGEIICGNSSCKAGTQFKRLNDDQAAMLRFKFANAPKPPKEKKQEQE